MEQALKDIKVGDMVFVRIFPEDTYYIVDLVTEVNENTIKCGESVYRKSDGRRPNGSARCWIPSKKEVCEWIAEVKRPKLQLGVWSYFSKFDNVKKLTDRELMMIDNIIDRHNGIESNERELRLPKNGE